MTTCTKYGGVQKENVCCAAKCGTCGGKGCGIQPGGPFNCCTSKIPLQHICGAERIAPCHLKNGT